MLRPRDEARVYAVRHRIAAGGMGEVYAGQAEDGRPVAIKRMLEQAAQDEDLVSLFLREMLVASTLEHHNVVEVIDVGRSGPDLILVMELVDGPTLAELLDVLKMRGFRVPLAVSCGIAMEIAQGLAHAHERALPDGTPLGIVHRDIAPENVIVNQEGIPKLVDFGLAKLDGQSLTQPGTIRGRPRSLAPEQARGDETDARTDIFALGTILFELVSGEQLYPDEKVATLLWRVAQGKYDPIKPRLKDVDPALIAIIQRSIAVDPNTRYRSARQLERDLGAFQASRELKVSHSMTAALVEAVWGEVQSIRHRSLKKSVAELEGMKVVFPAEKVEPIAPNEPDRSPDLGPRPAGWDRIIPTPGAPARAAGADRRVGAWWTIYGLALSAIVVGTYLWTYLAIP